MVCFNILTVVLVSVFILWQKMASLRHSGLCEWCLCTQRLIAELQCTHLELIPETSAVNHGVTSTQYLNGSP